MSTITFQSVQHTFEQAFLNERKIPTALTISEADYNAFCESMFPPAREFSAFERDSLGEARVAELEQQITAYQRQRITHILCYVTGEMVSFTCSSELSSGMMECTWVLATSNQEEQGKGMHTDQELDVLLTWKDGWNGYDAKAPDPLAVQHAKTWIAHFAREVGDTWVEPNVTGGAHGEVVFEWRQGQKKLTVYVSNENVEYVQVWSEDADAKIAEGKANTSEEQLQLWTWLKEGEQEG